MWTPTYGLTYSELYMCICCFEFIARLINTEVKCQQNKASFKLSPLKIQFNSYEVASYGKSESDEYELD